MDKFYPGQRVRIRYAYTWPHLNNCVVKIVKPRAQLGHGFCYETDCIIDGVRFCPEESQLEEADDGRTLVKWDSCAWNPNESI